MTVNTDKTATGIRMENVEVRVLGGTIDIRLPVGGNENFSNAAFVTGGSIAIRMASGAGQSAIHVGSLTSGSQFLTTFP